VWVGGWRERGGVEFARPTASTFGELCPDQLGLVGEEACRSASLLVGATRVRHRAQRLTNGRAHGRWSQGCCAGAARALLEVMALAQAARLVMCVPRLAL